MYNHILVPIVFDHGDRAEVALQIARRLLAEGGTITLMHVLEDIPAYAATHIPSGVREQHHRTATKELNKLAEHATGAAKTATVVVHGHAAQAIMDHSDAHGADCVVIASHKPGFEDYFLGSTAARVVRHSKCAVHVMR